MRLIAEDICTRRGERVIFAGVSLGVSAGETLIVTGPNGSGKSTLLKTIAGFLSHETGRIELEGAGDGTIGEHCHYLGHENGLKATLSLRENLEFWQRFLGAGADLESALSRVGLSGLEDLPAGYLSAGQKRRAALARLLMSERPLWLVDEPTAALDKASEARFAKIVETHLEAGGMVIAATHQPLQLSRPATLDIGQFAYGAAT